MSGKDEIETNPLEIRLDVPLVTDHGTFKSLVVDPYELTRQDQIDLMNSSAGRDPDVYDEIIGRAVGLNFEDVRELPSPIWKLVDRAVCKALFGTVEDAPN